MTNAKQTPGPWHFEANRIWECNDNTTPIAFTDTERPESENEANGHLIAAAPDLLKALHKLTHEAESRAGVPKALIAEMRAVIAKATGQPVS